MENGNPEKVLYISRNGSFLYFRKWKTFYILGSNFPSSKNEKNPLLKSFLYFRKQNFLVSVERKKFFKNCNSFYNQSQK